MADKDKQTKFKIFQIAIGLFKEKGFDSVTILDICAASAVSKHTFYYYFASKDELLMAFHHMPENIHADCLQDILAAENSFEQYMLLTEHMTNFFIELGPEISKRIISLNVTRKSNSLEDIHKHKLRETEAGIIRKAQAAGEIRNQSNADMLVGISFGLLFSAVFHWSMSDGNAFGLREMTRAALETALDVRPDLRKGHGNIAWLHSHDCSTK